MKQEYVVYYVKMYPNTNWTMETKPKVSRDSEPLIIPNNQGS